MIQGTETELKASTQKIHQAYNRVFERNSPFVLDVLEDLAKFCRATETTFHPDPRVHAALEGRREVFLRIQQHLQLSFEDVYKLHVIHSSKQRSPR